MNFQTFTYTLNPGEARKITRRGRHIRGMASDETYAIRLDDGAPTKFQTGIAFDSPQVFTAVEIINTAAQTQTIEVLVSDGPVDDNRLVGQVDISGGIRAAGNRSATYGAVTVGTSAQLVAAANNNRGTVLVQNLGAAPVYLGTDASVTTGTGLELAAGGVATLTVQTAVYAIAGSAGQDVRFLEESL